MSFVGTRPEVVKYVKKYKPEYFATLLLPAGITSEASIKYKDEAELLDAAEDVDEVYITKVLPEKMKEWLERRIKKADFSEKMRLHYYLGVILDDEDEVQECFRTIQSEVLASTIKNLSYNENARIVTEKHTVKLPLRVNWGGGWSDTPPYCNENGGTVLNVAILLNGQKPVEVTLEKISEKKIVFDSRDMDVHGEFDTIEPLQATGDG